MNRTTLWILIPLLLGAASLDGAVVGRRQAPAASSLAAPHFSEFRRERSFWTAAPDMTVIRGHLEQRPFAERLRN